MPSLRESILKLSISILFHVRGNGSFPGLKFHIKEVPPAHREDAHKKKCFFSGRTIKVLPSLHQWLSGPSHFFYVESEPAVLKEIPP